MPETLSETSSGQIDLRKTQIWGLENYPNLFTSVRYKLFVSEILCLTVVISIS